MTVSVTTIIAPAATYTVPIGEDLYVGPTGGILDAFLVVVEAANCTVDGFIDSTDIGVRFKNLGCSLDVDVDATISGNNYGVQFDANATAATMFNAGWISGAAAGVLAHAADVTLQNEGLISGTYYGVLLNGAGASLTNSGTIEGFDDFAVSAATRTAVLVTAAGAEIINSGTIRALHNTAINLTSATIITNSGLIEADATNPLAYAIRGSSFSGIGSGASTGADIVTNSGEIRGQINLFGSADRYDGRTGFVTGPVSGGAGADSLYSGAGAEWILGEDGDDRLLGGGGNDTVSGGAGADLLNGGLGTDLMDYTGSSAVLINLATGQATGGEATGDQFAGFEQVRGGSGADSLVGSAVENWLWGGASADLLSGAGDDDRLFGGAGSDILDGGTGNDRLQGGAGNDLYRVDLATDEVVEAADSGNADSVEAAVTWTLGAEVENLRLIGIAQLNGTGNALANVLTGNGEDNALNGAAGNDRLMGEGGNDRLEGEAGRDTVAGGMGNDAFQFVTPSDGGDRITDFSSVVGNNDHFRISAAGFGGGLVAGATLAASQFQVRTDNLAQDSDDRFIFRTTDKTLWFDSNGDGAGGLTLVADLQSSAGLTALDIWLI